MGSFNQNVSQNVIKHKAGLLNLATELGNDSKALKLWSYPARSKGIEFDAFTNQAGQSSFTRLF